MFYSFFIPDHSRHRIPAIKFPPLLLCVHSIEAVKFFFSPVRRQRPAKFSVVCLTFAEILCMTTAHIYLPRIRQFLVSVKFFFLHFRRQKLRQFYANPLYTKRVPKQKPKGKRRKHSVLCAREQIPIVFITSL